MNHRLAAGRDPLLRGAVALGLFIATSTELLGAFGLLQPLPVAAAWIAFLAATTLLLTRRLSLPQRPAWPGILDTLLLAFIAAALLILAVTALLSPPNSSDAMAYHMPRVIYWAQNASVAFFPTPYFNQISLQPLAEYFALHTYLVTGGDRLVNLIQWFGFAGSGLAVSLIAHQLGAARRGQILAALFCFTLPNGILQATGAKNDCILTLWLAAMIYFALRRELAWTAAALALALFTKGTAYLFAPPLLLAAASREWIRPRTPAVLLGAVLLINGPLYLRNIAFSGSPLGYDSAQGDGTFRWQNERFGLRTTASNILRHLGDQLGMRSESWNHRVYDAVVRIHQSIGADPSDPATTWPWTQYEPPRNANHETNTNNHWHLLLIAVLLPASAVFGNRRVALYAFAIVVAFVLFCAYLKWQLFMARMLLPLFVLAAPLAGILGERLRPAFLQIALCLLLIDGSRRYFSENWIRPLEGPNSILHTARNDNYFADMTAWDNKQSYLDAVDLLAKSNCTRIGIDINYLQLEYPLQALLLQRQPNARFTHTGVRNASTRYARPQSEPPCAIVCLDCADIQAAENQYANAGQRHQVGRFLVFLRH